jgi:hypothetical protein
MKYSGVVGFGISKEDTGDKEGAWDLDVVEKPYYGDVLNTVQRWDANQDSVIDNMRLTNRISIVADGFAMNHMHTMKYITYEGGRWCISSIEVMRPRLIISLGGVYHGPTPTVASDSQESV